MYNSPSGGGRSARGPSATEIAKTYRGPAPRRGRLRAICVLMRIIYIIRDRTQLIFIYYAQRPQLSHDRSSCIGHNIIIIYRLLSILGLTSPISPHFIPHPLLSLCHFLSCPEKFHAIII